MGCKDFEITCGGEHLKNFKNSLDKNSQNCCKITSHQGIGLLGHVCLANFLEFLFGEFEILQMVFPTWNSKSSSPIYNLKSGNRRVQRASCDFSGGLESKTPAKET